MADDDDNSKLHIAMFPWLAFGHMIPFLSLAKLIAKKGHIISFISTPRNIDRLQKLHPTLSTLIHFVKIPLPHVQNLPQNAEATSDLSLNDVWYLKKAFDRLQKPMSHLLQSLSPDWLLCDFTAYWLPAIARTNLGIPTVFFSIFIAAGIGYLGPSSVMINGNDDLKKPEDYTVSPKWVPFPSTVAYRMYEILRIFKNITGDKSNMSDIVRFGIILRDCDLIAVRSCIYFEPEWLKLLEDLHRKPIIPVGQLATTEHDTEDDTDTWRSIKEWLNKQEKGSVVYTAFGSEVKPSQEELTEIALGLELSGLPFFWVLRTHRGLTDAELVELPKGFEEKTEGRGVVCTSWAPQLKILAHDSVGGFLTHSGWSSVVEALQFARPLILLTFLNDQGLNARVLEEKNIGYSVPRDERDGSFNGNSVAESLRLVLVEEKGKIFREKVKEMKGLFGDSDRQDKYVDNLLAQLKSYKKILN